MKKVIVIHNVITPYRNHLFNRLHEYYSAKGIAFKVVFLSKTDKNRHWTKFDINFDFEILPNIALRFGNKDLYTFFLNPGILNLLKKENPDKLICFNWDHLAAYLALLWSRKNKKQFVLWSGSTDYEKSWRRTLLDPIVKYIVRRSSNCIGDGTRHRDYLLKLGAKSENTDVFYFQVDIKYFQNKLEHFKPQDRLILKNKLGIVTSKIVFYNGQFIERKGVIELLHSFKKFQSTYKDLSLLLLGNGRERNKMESIISKEKIPNVFFVDFVQYDDVYKYFAISDLFVLPSREEAWGLVINEAMACGLPVITTNMAGCSPDLIKEGENGFIITANSIDSLVKAFSKVFENNLIENNNSKEIINRFNIDQMISSTNSLQI